MPAALEPLLRWLDHVEEPEPPAPALPHPRLGAVCGLCWAYLGLEFEPGRCRCVKGGPGR